MLKLSFQHYLNYFYEQLAIMFLAVLNKHTDAAEKLKCLLASYPKIG